MQTMEMPKEPPPPPPQTADDEPGLLRGWSHDYDDVPTSMQTEHESRTETDSPKKEDRDALVETPLPKFQPGDHVIRWKIIKLMLWPIQIHGIVLSTELEEDGTCSVVIADFGYSSSENGKKRGLRGINNMMKSFYDKSNTNNTNNQNNNMTPPPPSPSDIHEEEDDEDSVKEDGKRFHIRTITDPAILKKWSKVNYGQSIFSSKGKLDKLKNLFKFPQKQNKKGRTADDDSTEIIFDEHDDFFKSHDDQSTGASSNYKDAGMPYSHNDVPPAMKQDEKDGEKKDAAKLNPIAQLVAQANEVERRARANRYRSGRSSYKISDESSVSSSISSNSKMSFRAPLIRPVAGMNKLMKKLTFQRNKNTEDYDTIPTSVSEEMKGSQEDAPKLPKSDPRTIVLARVKYILGEQEKPKEETSLPAYHILYSNSECLAVWCKTGKFSTLQAAVFLHSTAVGNAKSSFMLGAGVAATQPWLIPVVGVYAVAAVGMPYVLLNKCKHKWKESELRMTTSFWDNAGTDVFVAAIENWSGLCPDKQEDSDEVQEVPVIEQV